MWSHVSYFQHYEKDANGLCTQLKKPVAKQGNLDFCVDRQQFIKQGWVIKLKEIKLLEKLGDGDFGGKADDRKIYHLSNIS